MGGVGVVVGEVTRRGRLRGDSTAGLVSWSAWVTRSERLRGDSTGRVRVGEVVAGIRRQRGSLVLRAARGGRRLAAARRVGLAPGI